MLSFYGGTHPNKEKAVRVVCQFCSCVVHLRGIVFCGRVCLYIVVVIFCSFLYYKFMLKTPAVVSFPMQLEEKKNLPPEEEEEGNSPLEAETLSCF